MQPPEALARDAELVTRTLAGDTDAFSSLYEAHAGAVHTVVAAGISNPTVRADCVQEIFARALERLSSLRDPTRFRPWLLAIARNVVTDVHRSGARNPTLEDPGENETVAPDPTPSDLLELGQLSELVNGCLAGMSTRDATAVALVTYFDFSPAEVAESLGITPGAAKVAVHRARRRLRDALVLQVMVRGLASGCATFTQLHGAGELLGAERHARDCDRCLAALRAELLPST
ncbi:MAG: RNA polymerase sigma factor [Acidimicrobiales bacterium]|jgi:RNA polymerase sigma-70 factor (ECF subfamily)|nr:RNA polymerase sigma factor [Acidimicrobiales bacterium]